MNSPSVLPVQDPPIRFHPSQTHLNSLSQTSPQCIHYLAFIPLQMTLLPPHQTLQKRLGIRFPTEEIDERFHLVPAPSRSQNLSPVLRSSNGIHRVGREDCAEHVCRERLRVEVSVCSHFLVSQEEVRRGEGTYSILRSNLLRCGRIQIVLLRTLPHSRLEK
jgi:hypothetical protein